jgi:hypothetical protein
MLTKFDIKSNLEYKFKQSIAKLINISDYFSYFISNAPYHLISKDIETYFNDKEIVFLKLKKGEYYFKKVNGKLFIESKKYKLASKEKLEFEVDNYKVSIEIGKKVKKKNKVYQRIKLNIE